MKTIRLFYLMTIFIGLTASNTVAQFDSKLLKNMKAFPEDYLNKHLTLTTIAWFELNRIDSKDNKYIYYDVCLYADWSESFSTLCKEAPRPVIKKKLASQIIENDLNNDKKYTVRVTGTVKKNLYLYTGYGEYFFIISKIEKLSYSGTVTGTFE